MPVREAIHRYLTALRLVYVPFREAEPAQLHNACYRDTAAKRHPDGQRDDGFTAYGRLPLAESGFFHMVCEIYSGPRLQPNVTNVTKREENGFAHV